MKLQAAPAHPHELPDVLALLTRCELSTHEVARGLGHYFVVREDDGRVVGVAGLEPYGREGLLRSVAVEASYRGQGLAGALVAAVVERARTLELRELYLLTTTAHDYFARRGFLDCEREATPSAIQECWEFRAGCPKTAVVMRRPVR